MQKRAVLTFTLLTLTACFLTYKLGSAPTVLAKAHTTPQDESARVLPPLAAPPGTWVVTSTPAEGTPASAVKAAGGSGVQHVASCVSATILNFNGTLHATTLQLYDGTTLLMQWYVLVPISTTGSEPGYFSFSQCDINVQGSPNTSMTLKLENTVNAPNQEENVNLVGYDAS